MDRVKSYPRPVWSLQSLVVLRHTTWVLCRGPKNLGALYTRPLSCMLGTDQPVSDRLSYIGPFRKRRSSIIDKWLKRRTSLCLTHPCTPTPLHLFVLCDVYAAEDVMKLLAFLCHPVHLYPVACSETVSRNSAAESSQPSRFRNVKVKKVKVRTLDIAPLRETPPQKRSGIFGTCSQGISQFYLHTPHELIRNRNEPYLPLPSHAAIAGILI